MRLLSIIKKQHRIFYSVTFEIRYKFKHFFETQNDRSKIKEHIKTVADIVSVLIDDVVVEVVVVGGIVVVEEVVVVGEIE